MVSFIHHYILYQYIYYIQNYFAVSDQKNNKENKCMKIAENIFKLSVRKWNAMYVCSQDNVVFHIKIYIMLLCRIEFPTYGMKMASWVTNSQNIGSFHCHPHSACWSHSCCSKHSSPTWPRKSVPSFSIYLISSTSTTMITCYLVKMSPPTNWFTKQHAHAGWTDCPDCIISKVLGF